MPYDVTPEQALNHGEVRTHLDASIRDVKAVTDKFLSAIVVQLTKSRKSGVSPRYPAAVNSGFIREEFSLAFYFLRSYGMRFIAKVLKDSRHDKFPDAGEDELLKVRS